MGKLIRLDLDDVYLRIPADYLPLYHTICQMMADYGEDMLKDCKAKCKDKNESAIDCYNMFNAALSAKKLGKDKLAETIIVYLKAKIKQIYNKKIVTEFVYPLNNDGTLQLTSIFENEMQNFYIDETVFDCYFGYVGNETEGYDIESAFDGKLNNIIGFHEISLEQGDYPYKNYFAFAVPEWFILSPICGYVDDDGNESYVKATYTIEKIKHKGIVYNVYFITDCIYKKDDENELNTYIFVIDYFTNKYFTLIKEE